MNSTNPYDILGVDKNATSDEINAAYKAKAKKAHPDRGGKTEDFTRIKQASMVLLDPEKRSKFDDEGIVDDNKADNIAALAMEAIAGFFINSINATMDQPVNIEQFDFVKGAKTYFAQNMNEGYKRIAQVERQIKQFEKALKRLKTKRPNDVIKNMITAHAVALKVVIENNERQIKIEKTAQDILNDYEFIQDTTPYPNQGFAKLFTPRGQF